MQTDPSLAQAARRFCAAATALAEANGPTTSNRAEGPPTPELAELLTLLGEQPEWRAYVDGTKNFGHQASTVQLLRRLIELTSFRGRVVLVYADPAPASSGRTADKLAMMFVGLDPAHIDSTVAAHASCREIRFLPLARATELREAVAFGFSGGADDMRLNGAAALNVRFFMRLQPYLWDDPPTAAQDAYYECSRLEQPDGRHLYPVQAWPDFRLLPIRPPDSVRHEVPLSSWRWYAQRQTFDPGLACRMRNAHAVLEARRARRWLLWPVYGLQHFKHQAAAMMLTLTLAALAFASARRCTILLCSFNPTDEVPDWAQPVQAIRADAAHSWADGLRENAPQTLLHLHRAYDDGRWREFAKPLADSPDCGEDASAVHVLDLGPVAMDAFHQFVLNADLPCVIEGQTTANLLSVMGRPFLQVLRSEHSVSHGYPALPGAPTGIGSESTACQLASLGAAVCRSSATAAAASDERIATLRRLTRLLEDASTADSGLNRYFAGVRQHFAQPSSDKVAMMLLALREVMLAA